VRGRRQATLTAGDYPTVSALLLMTLILFGIDIKETLAMSDGVGLS
jgi:hypothetical protein